MVLNREIHVGAIAQEHAEHRACVRCVDAGYLPRAHPVFSGRPGQRILLVGQAPGQVEDDVTRPFAGRAGRQLMRWMSRAGFAGEDDFRDRVYMTSMTSCFPGRVRSGTGDRRPSTAEVRLCARWMDGALAIVEPRLIIAVGGLAHSRFCPRQPLDALVGRVFDREGNEIAEGRSPTDAVVVPLPHPSGASRWLNDPGHGVLLEQALDRIVDLAEWADGIAAHERTPSRDTAK